MQASVGVILSGCGFRDGAEVYETTSALFALHRHGVQVKCYAPSLDFEVVDYLTKEPTGQKRNVLQEAARIVRGEIEDLRMASAAALDALVLPGGFGAALNLSDFGMKGAECSVQEDVAMLIADMHASGKPIGAICIAPAVVARVLHRHKPVLTIGSDSATAGVLEAMGAVHAECAATEIVVDERNRLVSTPAYMLATNPAEVFTGVGKLVDALIGMIDTQQE